MGRILPSSSLIGMLLFQIDELRLKNSCCWCDVECWTMLDGTINVVQDVRNVAHHTHKTTNHHKYTRQHQDEQIVRREKQSY